MTWDDHEFKDNYADLDLDPDEPLETVTARRAAAYLAYWEHSPLARSRKPVGKDMNLYRRAQWGDVATFHVLDTRQHRSDQMAAQCTRVDRHPETGYYCPTQLDESRTILGAEQRDWLFEGLAGAPAGGWNVLANQVGFAAQDLNNDAILRRYSPDSWDGYVADRQRVLDFLAEKSLSNTLVITGDKHYHSVRDVAESYVDLTGTPIATEFIGSSISSVESGNPVMPGTSFGGDADNPHIKFENHQRGYVSVTLDHERCVGDYRVVDALHEDSPVTSIARAEVLRAEPGAVVTPVTGA
jgi:alkaline phosphatase D